MKSRDIWLWLRSVWIPAFLLVMGCLVSSSSSGSLWSISIPSSGTVRAASASREASITFRSSMEDVVKVDDHHLSWTLNHWIGGTGGETGARFGIVDFGHSSSKSLMLELFDITKSRRAEMKIYGYPTLFGSELCMSMWYYLPSDWKLTGEDYKQNQLIEIREWDKDRNVDWMLSIYIKYSDGKYVFEVGHKDNTVGQSSYVMYGRAGEVPRGQWFELKFYVKRHSSKGIVALWLNNYRVIYKEDCKTRHVQDEYYLVPVKQYCDKTDTYPKTVYADDLTIANALVKS